ncbi:helix-turn-helix transcriptional regulator [Enterocloster clostridioformis]
MNSFYNRAGLRIRDLREAKNYTREELAEIAEISAKFLYEIETGQKGFSADTLYRISRALCVNCEYILTGDNGDINHEEVIRVLNLFGYSKNGKIKQLLELVYELGNIT